MKTLSCLNVAGNNDAANSRSGDLKLKMRLKIMWDEISSDTGRSSLILG